MRIVYLHQYFATPSGSSGTRSFEMARRLVAAGHEVHVVTSSRLIEGPDRGWGEQTVEGIHVHALANIYSDNMGTIRRIWSYARFALLSMRRARSLGGDVVFATSTPLTISIPGVWASWRNSIPMVFEVRDLWPEMPIAIGALKNRFAIVIARWLEKVTYRRSERVVALSPQMAEGVVATGYEPARVATIPNSCDFDLFSVSPTAGEAFRRRDAWIGDRRLVLYAGSFGQVNDLAYLVRLAEAVYRRDPEIRFLLVGEGREEEHVRSEALRLGVLDVNLKMCGPMPKTEVVSALSAADVACSIFIDLPEMWANSANKWFDALASGTPTLVNYRGWQAELLEATGAGLVVSATDLELAADDLVERLHDPSWCTIAGEAAEELGRARFDRDDLAHQLEDVLEQAVGDHGSRSRRFGPIVRRR